MSIPAAVAPRSADGVPVSHVEPTSPIYAPLSRAAPSDGRIASFMATEKEVERMMRQPGSVKYDHEKARREQWEAQNKKPAVKEKAPDVDAMRKAEQEIKTAADLAHADLAKADLVNEVERVIDRQDSAIKGPFVPTTKDFGKSEKRPFTAYMYLDKAELVVDATTIHDQFLKKLTVMPYASNNPLVAAAIQDKEMQEQAMSFLSLMFFSPTHVCTPGLYAFLHHQTALEKDSTTRSRQPAIISTAVLYRYYRALFTAIGGFMKLNDNGRGLYEKVFVKAYKDVKVVSDVRSRKLRRKMQELAAACSFTDISQEAQAQSTLVEWCTTKPLGKRLAMSMDDLMFRHTVFHLNAMELAICEVLCIDAQRSSELCTPMVRPLLAEHLSMPDKKAAREHSYTCIKTMCNLYQGNQLKSSSMAVEGRYLLALIEKEKEAVFTGEVIPVALDGVTPQAFYFLRLCAWLRMHKLENEVVIHTA